MKAICVNEQSRAPATNKGSPPPTMVFDRQLEIRHRDGDKAANQRKQRQRNEQNAKQGVHSVAPHRCKDVMQFNVNRTKR